MRGKGEACVGKGEHVWQRGGVCGEEVNVCKGGKRNRGLSCQGGMHGRGCS